MKVSVSVGSAYSTGEDWSDIVDFVVEAEKLGVDSAWSAEAWGMDAIVPLAYLAARTSVLKLGTGIMQVSARAPVMTAMTAQSMDTVSNGRFLLGLGVSGPQVVEGLHGVAFAKPLSRLRETIDIIRMGLRGEKIAYEGEHFVLPRPGGEGKPIRLAQPRRAEVPIYLATLGPKSLEFTGEVADGWLGTSFMPEHADVFLEPLRRGAERAGRSLADIDIQVGGLFAVDEDIERLIASRRPGMAFTLGAMGSAQTNFYNDAYRRAGYQDAAIEVQRLWIEGKRDEAMRRVPEEMILKSGIIGTEAMVRERLRAYRDAGVTTLRLSTEGKTWPQRLEHLAQAMDLIRSELADPQSAAG